MTSPAQSPRSGGLRPGDRGRILTYPASTIPRPPLRFPECALCGDQIAGGWVHHDGEPVHPSCWSLTGFGPDIIVQLGDYRPGGRFYGAVPAW